MADPADPQGAASGHAARTDAPDAGASPRRDVGRGRRRADTRDPRRARERALKILFQADVRGLPADQVLARIADDPRAWAMLDDLDPDEAADLGGPVDAADADADPEPHEVARAARRRRALELDGFTRSLVRGVAEHQAALDELIQRYARRWTVARMPAIDRNVLRLGAYELAFETTSPAVVINEVIELAKRLSTEDSGRYVNGVLESVRKHLAATPLGTAEVTPVVPDTVPAPPHEPTPEVVDDPVEETLPAPGPRPVDDDPLDDAALDQAALDDAASDEPAPDDAASDEDDPGQPQLF